MKRKRLLDYLISDGAASSKPALNAVRGEIIAALEAGWEIKKIWRGLVAQGVIKIGYQCFYTHVRAKILPQIRQSTTAPSAPLTVPAVGRAEPTESVPKPPPKMVVAALPPINRELGDLPDDWSERLKRMTQIVPNK